MRQTTAILLADGQGFVASANLMTEDPGVNLYFREVDEGTGKTESEVMVQMTSGELLQLENFLTDVREKMFSKWGKESVEEFSEQMDDDDESESDYSDPFEAIKSHLEELATRGGDTVIRSIDAMTGNYSQSIEPDFRPGGTL